MNVYGKLAKARLLLKQRGIAPTGKNAFSNYKYFELADFIPAITEIEAQQGLISVVHFGSDTAWLKVVNTEEPKEEIFFSAPMSTANLKGCHEVQNLGAVITYLRRYLYNLAYEIVDCDALDSGEAEKEKAEKEKAEKEKAEKEKAEKLAKLRAERIAEVTAIMEEKGLDKEDLAAVKDNYGIEKIEQTNAGVYKAFIEALKKYGNN